MKRNLIGTMISAAVLIAAPGLQGASPFAGRWDITVTTPNSTYPGWMEFSESGGQPKVRVQPRAGTVRPAGGVKGNGSHMTLVLTPVSGDHRPHEFEPSTTAVFDQRLTRTGAMMGTPAYMAPEQFRGRATDARSDQFAFCVALYEALYGERPFGGNTLMALTNNVVNGRIRETPANVNVPPWIRKILLRGLRVNADERFP
jgi:serine/threonine protein kinase